MLPQPGLGLEPEPELVATEDLPPNIVAVEQEQVEDPYVVIAAVVVAGVVAAAAVVVVEGQGGRWSCSVYQCKTNSARRLRLRRPWST